jgi:hypothetical protein
MQLKNISINQVKQWNYALEAFERQYTSLYHEEVYSYRRNYMDCISLGHTLGRRLVAWLNEAKRRDRSGDIPEQVVHGVPRNLLDYLKEHGTHHMSGCGYIHHSMIEKEVNERLWKSARQQLQEWDAKFRKAYA